MTIPTLMNCPHSGEGWCLSCVEKLSAELDDCYFSLSIALTQSYDGPLPDSARERISDVMNKHSGYVKGD